MGYSVYVLSAGSFARMPDSLRRQGLEVVEIPYMPDTGRMDFESIETPDVRRSIYRTKIRSIPVDLFCTTQLKSGPAA